MLVSVQWALDTMIHAYYISLFLKNNVM